MKTRKEKIQFLESIKAGDSYWYMQFLSQLSNEEILKRLGKILNRVVKHYHIQDDEHLKKNICTAALSNEGIENAERIVKVNDYTWEKLRNYIFN